MKNINTNKSKQNQEEKILDCFFKKQQKGEKFTRKELIFLYGFQEKKIKKLL